MGSWIAALLIGLLLVTAANSPAPEDILPKAGSESRRRTIDHIGGSPASQHLFIARRDGSHEVFDIRSRQVRLVGPKLGSVTAATMAKSGKRAFVATESHEIVVLDEPFGSVTARFPGHTRAVVSLVLNESANILYSGSYDRSIRVWASDSLKLLRVKQMGSEVLSMDLVCDGKYLAVALAAGGVKLLNPRTLDEAHEIVAPDVIKVRAIRGTGGFLVAGIMLKLFTLPGLNAVILQDSPSPMLVLSSSHSDVITVVGADNSVTVHHGLRSESVIVPASEEVIPTAWMDASGKTLLYAQIDQLMRVDIGSGQPPRVVR